MFARRRLLPVFALIAALLGCESTTEPASDEPEGVSVTLNGTIVARAVNGVTEGEVHVHVGEYSGVFVVSILDGAGRPLMLEPDHYLEVSVGDLGLAAFVQPTPGAFEGEIEMYGLEGESTLTFRLMRTGAAVPEWTSPPIDLVVVAC